MSWPGKTVLNLGFLCTQPFENLWYVVQKVESDRSDAEDFRRHKRRVFAKVTGVVNGEE